MAKHLVRSSDTGPEQSELDRLFPERLDSKQDQQAAQSQCSSCIATLRLLHNLAHFAEFWLARMNFTLYDFVWFRIVS